MADTNDRNSNGNSNGISNDRGSTQSASSTQGSRDRYRDNDDVRDPLEADARTAGNPSTESEARGDARENVGNHSRNTDADPSGAEGNDNTRNRPRPDSFDQDLERR